MSMAALDWAFECEVRGPGKAVLIVLANHANESDECWPSHERIARHSGFSLRAVRYAVRDLVAYGFIAIEEQPGRPLRYLLRTATPASGAGVARPPPRHVVPTTPARRADPPRHVVPIPLHHVPTNPKEPTVQPRKNLKNAQARSLFADPDVGSVPVLVNGKAAAFEEFWQLYPKRLQAGKMVRPDRAGAERAFATAIKRVSPRAIIEAVKQFPFERERPQYIPGPAVWLHKGNFMADVDEPERVLTLTELDEYQSQQARTVQHGD